ncbi:MAG: N-6 DNA methylase [Arenimonas sp.]|uniref:DNA methyltransferase n=1 Tax=Arenimonas sp. TaxID=1872635 RepID=UPI0025BF9AF4|nr:DNA methyltransferase [Arenimonas sp.]MBW8366641.1 N-6 DNA methylase [Arenimonas sp.]
MSDTVQKITDFVSYVSLLDGDEKGEAQVFCDRLFIAFGHAGYKEAGATLEFRIKKNSSKGTSFADLVWKPRVLFEMKRRGEKLHLHYAQAFTYWMNAVPARPRFVVLCNFDEFWIYDFDKQLHEPVDRVSIEELPHRYTALNFMFPEDKDPLFLNNREVVSRGAAEQTAELFRSLTQRTGKNKVEREAAQRFVLQLVVAMFAEDIDLLPLGTVSRIVKDCLDHKQSAFDLFDGLFRQMNNPVPAKAGRYANVPYFNGGLFSKVDVPVLTNEDLNVIGGKDGIASKNWSKIDPVIFGTLFQQSMDAAVQHKHGRHFTSEADIQRIVGPSIERPWREEIDAATSLKDLVSIRARIATFKVLDPSCGSGNFLYVAYREMVRLDIRLMSRLKEKVSEKEFQKQFKVLTVVSPKNFFGIDNDAFAVELAKVTLMLAKKLAHDEAVSLLHDEGIGGKGSHELDLAGDAALPLDNLDANFLLGDALFLEWPTSNAIVGNPPFQSKNKIQQELGPAYTSRLREHFPEIDGRADYCVYWVRKAHDHLKPGERAGLVGTNTIRQNYSRMGGLDYIVANGGQITEAISSMIWPGTAVVHVSVVNWIKSAVPGKKRLYIQEGNDIDDGWRHADLDSIPSSLSFAFDVTSAESIVANADRGKCFQGQTHGHEGFLMETAIATSLIAKDAKYNAVLKPFLTADDLVGSLLGGPSRFVIDFSGMESVEAGTYKEAFGRVESLVLPARLKAAKEEAERNKDVLEGNARAKVNWHHRNFLNHWWRMSYQRDQMMREISKLGRYIVCGAVTKRPIFEFISSKISPNAALTVFAHDDDYTFGILQSGQHWLWFSERCSTMKSDPRYTSNTVFDSFPWPQKPSTVSVRKVAAAARALRAGRRELRDQYRLSFRDMYRNLEMPGANPLKVLQTKLDNAVSECYGIKKTESILVHLLGLNKALAAAEKIGTPVQTAGVPAGMESLAELKSTDCVET